MAGVSLWVRREWSRRWLGLLGLGLLIAVVGGVTLAVVNGARRTSTAFDRLRDVTNAFEVTVEVQPPETADGIDVSVIPPPDELADRIAAVEGVEGVTVATFLAAGIGDDVDDPLHDRAQRRAGQGADLPARRRAPAGGRRGG